MSIFGPSFVDIAKAQEVSITIDQNSEGIQVWVDVDSDGCRTRIYRIKNLTVTDRRTKTENPE